MGRVKRKVTVVGLADGEWFYVDISMARVLEMLKQPKVIFMNAETGWIKMHYQKFDMLVIYSAHVTRVYEVTR